MAINEPDTRSNPNPTTKQHALVSIRLIVVTCPAYPEKFIRDDVVSPFYYIALSLSVFPFDALQLATHMTENNCDPFELLARRCLLRDKSI